MMRMRTNWPRSYWWVQTCVLCIRAHTLQKNLVLINSPVPWKHHEYEYEYPGNSMSMSTLEAASVIKICNPMYAWWDKYLMSFVKSATSCGRVIQTKALKLKSTNRIAIGVLHKTPMLMIILIIFSPSTWNTDCKPRRLCPTWAGSQPIPSGQRTRPDCFNLVVTKHYLEDHCMIQLVMMIMLLIWMNSEDHWYK